MQMFEIEVKSLIGNSEESKVLLRRMRALDPDLKELGGYTQLNHYFIDGKIEALSEKLPMALVDDITRQKLKDIHTHTKKYSVRTRLTGNDALLVVKASVDDTSSENGTARIEVEIKTPNLTLGQLDEIVLSAGFRYQAKWSRKRRNFQYRGLSVCIDKNAGYGFLAEFEMMVDDPRKITESKEILRSALRELGLSELPQDRLERMFAHYNKNWREYYGTEKTFTLD